MNEHQNLLFQIITTKDIEEKVSLAKDLNLRLPTKIKPLEDKYLVHLKNPGRPDNIQVVDPRKVPRRSIENPEHRAEFLHAIANIELLAIELPALCLLRFGSDDSKFVRQLYIIMSQEALHFSLLQNRLKEMGSHFGEFPIHNGLWDYAWRCSSQLEHEIIIPCYLEARGLDVSPDFLKKFLAIGDEETARILKIIIADEVKHVKHGLLYLNKVAQKQNRTPDEVFYEVLKKFFGSKIKSRVALNQTYRKHAGFTEAQMEILQTGEFKKAN